MVLLCSFIVRHFSLENGAVSRYIKRDRVRDSVEGDEGADQGSNWKKDKASGLRE